MDKKSAEIALEFMKRVQLQGNEAITFVQVCAAIERDANPIEKEDNRVLVPGGKE